MNKDMEDERYRAILKKSPFGYAYYRIIYDEKGNPVDYEFLEVNATFESLTGFKAKEIIGKTVNEVIPGIKESKFNFAVYYSEVAVHGGEKEFEQFFEPLNKWYRVQASSPQKGYLMTIFTDISLQYKLAGIAQEFLTYTPETINYQKS